MKKLMASVLSSLVIWSFCGPASAASYGVSATPTSGLTSGTSVTLTVTGLSGSVGVYASVCKAGATQMDIPAPCDNATVSWITELGGMGSTAGAASFSVSSSFGTVDCLVDSCVIYVRGDHANSTNYSLIRTIPLGFAAGGPSRLTDSASARFGSVQLAPNQAGNISYRTPITLEVTAESGLPVTLSSLTGDCVVTNNSVTALIGSGVCAIAATTLGNEIYAPLSVNFPFYVGLGQQKILVGKFNRNIKIGAELLIPKSTIQSNFQAMVSVKSLTPTVCKLSLKSRGWRLSALKPGICKLGASSVALENMWTSAAREFKVKIHS